MLFIYAHMHICVYVYMHTICIHTSTCNLEAGRLVVRRIYFGPIENLQVALRRVVPRKVLLHGTLHHRFPGFFVVFVRVQCMPEAKLQPFAIAPVKLPAGAGTSAIFTTKRVVL